MWNAYGKSYLKINDQYVTTVLLDREFNRYGILNKSGNDLLTILRFDLENNSFRLETSEEKRLYELEKSIRRAGKKKFPRTISQVLRMQGRQLAHRVHKQQLQPKNQTTLSSRKILEEKKSGI